MKHDQNNYSFQMLKKLSFNLGMATGRHPLLFVFAGMIFLAFSAVGFVNF